MAWRSKGPVSMRLPETRRIRGAAMGRHLHGLAIPLAGALPARARRRRLSTLPMPRLPMPSAAPRAAGRPVGQLHGGAAILAFAVLADSGLEHYRAMFENKAMYAP